MATASGTTKPQTLTEKVYLDLKQRIERGEFGAARRLPSVAKLTEQYDVSSITIRGALRELGTRGLVSSRRRSGVFAEPRRPGISESSIAVLAKTGTVGANRQTEWIDPVSLGSFDAIRAEGLHVLAINPALVESDMARRLAEENIRGVIITESSSRADSFAWANLFREYGTPVVVAGDDASVQQFDRVTSDHEAGSYEITKWLIGQGRRRILPFWPAPATGYWFAERRAGYERAMMEAGLPAMPTCLWKTIQEPIAMPYFFEVVRRTMAGYLPEYVAGPDAIDALLLSSDGEVPSAAGALRLFGKEPNRDIAMVGYDNYAVNVPELEFEPTLPLATVDKCDRDRGEAMVKLLLDRLEGDLPDEPQRIVVKPRLVVTGES